MSFKSTGPKTRPDRVKPIPSPPLQSTSRRSSTSSATSTESFHSAQHSQSTSTTPAPPRLRFTPSVEALHVSSSNTIKSQANTQFAKGDFSSALDTYDKAIAELPVYLDYELAVLQSNVAACHIRLEEWKEAVRAAEKGWESLENLDPMPKPKPKPKSDSERKDKNGKKEDGDEGEGGEGDEVVELPATNTDAANEQLLRSLSLSDQRKTDIRRIRTKILLRRARARYMLGTTTPPPNAAGKENKNPFAQVSSLTSPQPSSSSADPSSSVSSAWSNLSASLTDYQLLSQPQFFSTLPTSDQKTVRTALATLPGLVDKAKEKEVAEMMGKLKELGNGILRPFGLSTDMFKMEKDPVSGGMSLKFDGKGTKGGE